MEQVGAEAFQDFITFLMIGKYEEDPRIDPMLPI